MSSRQVNISTLISITCCSLLVFCIALATGSQQVVGEESTVKSSEQLVNISQVLLDKFHYVFQLNVTSTTTSDYQDNQTDTYLAEAINKSKQQLDRLTELFVIINNNNNNYSSPASPLYELSSQPQTLQSNLETRTNFLLNGAHFAAQQQQQQQQRDDANKRNYVRILNRVFSRVELPEVFKRTSLQASSQSSSRVSAPASSANLQSSSSSSSQQAITSAQIIISGTSGSSGSSGSSSSSASNQASHCGNHIGCIAELPNFPVILKLKPNVSASFTIYTREKGPRHGARILFEPLMHYQLQDSQQTPSSSSSSSSSSAAEFAEDLLLNITRQLKQFDRGHAGTTSMSTGPAAAAPVRRKQVASQKRHSSTTSSSWMSSANKIVHSRELPFDLAALESSGFNASLTTRIIIGGYFAKEDEEWIEELIKQWLLLEPSNVIKVSWQDSNRGLYHSAAYNSRIVGRQLSLFLHYLNELFHIDLDKFHLVGHSLGAHIAGFVGADNEGQIARITGLDPAGPIFVELSGAHRLDASDAKFVDVVHTNGGTITKGALGLSTPSGHVDYYSNGGSLQPGCFFSSVTMSIMDPVERIACNHRRSYRYFTEIIKLAIRANEADDDATSSSSSALTKPFPHAFLFEVNKQEDLVKMVQPDVRLAAAGPSGLDNETPTRKVIEFHSLSPEFPRTRRGLYYFRTRTEAPFFGSKQYALRMRLGQPFKRKITLSIKINATLVAELELDELDDSRALLFVLQNSHLIDYANLFSGRASRAPDLWLMWRQRSFTNLLLAASHRESSELHLSSIELQLLDDLELATTTTMQNTTTTAAAVLNKSIQEQGNNHFVIKYEPNVVNNNNNKEQNFLSRIQSQAREQNNSPLSLLPIANSPPISTSTSTSSSSFVVTRNQWHKFDGRPVAISTT